MAPGVGRWGTVSKPNVKVFRSLPIQTHSLFDSVPDVDGAIQALDLGYFNQAALLVDACMRDDRIAGVLETRIGAIKAAPIECRPASEKAKAKKYAEEIGGTEGSLGLWSKIFPKEAVGEVIKWGLMVGIGVAQIVWDGAPDRWTPRIVPWHPQFIRFEWMSMTYKLQVAEGVEVTLPRVDMNPRGDGQWLVWCPYGYYYGWLSSLIRSLARKYIIRGWTERDWAHYNEVHGHPITVAYVPSGASQGEKDAFYSETSNRGSEATVMAPVGDGENRETSKYGVGLVEAVARTFDSFRLQKESIDTDIAVRILGQNLTTQVSEGSRAAAQVHDLVRLDKALVDAAFGTVAEQQVLSHDAEHNYGDPALAPHVEIVVTPPESETEEGAAFKSIGDGVAALKTGGFAVDVRAIGEARGIPMLSEEEEARQKEEAAARAKEIAGQGPPGAGGGDQGGGPKPPPPGAKDEPKVGAAAMHARYVAIPPHNRYEFQGLPIAVENPKGSTRVWREDGPDGAVLGQTQMQHDYGYIEGHTGADKEELDCYVGDCPAATDVHIVHQLRAPAFKAHDEDKVMLGFADAAAAKTAYLAHRNDGEVSWGGMSTIPLERFKATLARRTGTGKIRARASVAAQALELVGHAHEMKLAAAGPGAKRRARLYGDRVADRALALAGDALGPDRDAVLEEIGKAKDFTELRAGLLARFKGMDPARLTDLVFRARMMARVGGQASAVKRL